MQTTSNKISNASNETAAMLSIRILELVANSNIAEAMSGKAYLAHAEVSAEFEKATQGLDRKVLSIPVNKYFNDRYELFNNLYVYCNGQLNCPEAATAQAALQVFKVLNMYGFYFKNAKVEVQSLRFKQIIDGLKAPEMIAALTKLGILNKVEQLETVHIEYEKSLAVRSVTLKNKVSASSLRKKLNAAFKLHIDELQWLQRQTDSAAIANLNAEINTRIDEIVLRAKPSANENKQQTQQSA